LFSGTLVAGKNLLYAIQLIEKKLFRKDIYCYSNVLYDGIEREKLNLLNTNNLRSSYYIQGNQTKETIQI
jgi:hypothetical protein